ncbi:Septin-8-A [Apostichopus japonicus]|uniref:Septin-8-A n=1 Tax=Stichopus japonicus TaxID=307972 RepID=A0A2G8K0Z1_STIJA|nr:Septin-8-A [Apostichopus japonicus]
MQPYAFGLTNAPATFQRLMEHCVGDMNYKKCLVYLDDVIIFSQTFEEHLERLSAVLKRLTDFGLKLKPSKCNLLQNSVTYLGHVVSEHGVETDPEKIQAVKSWPVPQNVKQLRSFLGFTGYYRRFVEGYANIAAPLHGLTGNRPKQQRKRMHTAKEPNGNGVWNTKKHLRN